VFLLDFDCMVRTYLDVERELVGQHSLQVCSAKFDSMDGENISIRILFSAFVNFSHWFVDGVLDKNIRRRRQLQYKDNF
jgi:hypothetical protein